MGQVVHTVTLTSHWSLFISSSPEPSQINCYFYYPISQQDSCMLSTKNSELSLSKSENWLHTSRIGTTVTTDCISLVPEVMVTHPHAVFYYPQLSVSHDLPGGKSFISNLRLSASKGGDWSLY